MSEVDTMWFNLQYLKDGEDDFEDICVNFCGLISFLASVEKHKLLKITKMDIKFSD